MTIPELSGMVVMYIHGSSVAGGEFPVPGSSGLISPLATVRHIHKIRQPDVIKL
jgi:hypothetical protein